MSTSACFAFSRMRPSRSPRDNRGRERPSLKITLTYTKTVAGEPLNVHLLNGYNILTEHTGYTPSAWGTAQIDACKGKSSLDAFKTHFRALPHDKNAQVNTAAKLPTEQFYAYNGSLTLASFDNNKTLDKVFK